MKLTRNELLCAQDVQLHAIGLRRQGNSGWMQKALDSEFSPQQIHAFNNARKQIGAKPWRLTLTSPDGKDHEIQAYSREALKLEVAELLQRI